MTSNDFGDLEDIYNILQLGRNIEIEINIQPFYPEGESEYQFLGREIPHRDIILKSIWVYHSDCNCRFINPTDTGSIFVETCTDNHYYYRMTYADDLPG